MWKFCTGALEREKKVKVQLYLVQLVVKQTICMSQYGLSFVATYERTETLLRPPSATLSPDEEQITNFLQLPVNFRFNIPVRLPNLLTYVTQHSPVWNPPR